MHPHLSKLHPYPFAKLAQLKEGIHLQTHEDHIALSIGEPQHPVPELIAEAYRENVDQLIRYPSTTGLSQLRDVICEWLVYRYQLNPGSVDPDQHVLPVSGTREALFSVAQALVDSRMSPIVIMPNPFYQIYEGAALLAGAEPIYLNTLQQNGFIPEFDRIPRSIWDRCQLVYLCNPGNPTGSVMTIGQLRQLIELSIRYNFVIACDECYSEIYFDETSPPAGLLQAAQEMGNDRFQNCLVFHSLSKRSNAPGLRSGFVAGDPEIIKEYARYRSYHGCTLPLPSQLASIAAWSDERHVRENRQMYRQKFNAFVNILADVWPMEPPQASFYLWPKTPIADTEFASGLFAQQNITVLPGRFLSRRSDGINPGENRVRIALVQPLEGCITAAHRIKNYIVSV